MKTSDAQTNSTSTKIENATSGREPEVRPLGEAELDQVSGGIIAILIGLAVSPVPKGQETIGYRG
jgi:hypothetical protein